LPSSGSVAKKPRSPARIFAGHPWHSRIWPRVYRPLERIIPGTTDAADEMVRHFRHRHALRQSERQWLDIEVTSWTAGRAFNFEQCPIPGEIADRHRARWSRRSTPALGLVPVSLQLDEPRQPDDQSSEFLCLVGGQPLVREGDSVRWLSVQVHQRQAICVDDAISARDPLETPWWRKTALRHRASIRGRAVDRLSGIWPQETLGRPWINLLAVGSRRPPREGRAVSG
jgi:hypothetical protein